MRRALRVCLKRQGTRLKAPPCQRCKHDFTFKHMNLSQGPVDPGESLFGCWVHHTSPNSHPRTRPLVSSPGAEKQPSVSTSISSLGRSTITGYSPKSPEKCCQGHFLLIIACWRDSPVSHAYYKNEQMKAHHSNTFPRSLHVYMPSRLSKKTQNTFRSLPVTNFSNSKIIPSYFTYVNEVCWSWPKVSPPPVPIQPPFFPS